MLGDRTPHLRRHCVRTPSLLHALTHSKGSRADPRVQPGRSAVQVVVQ